MGTSRAGSMGGFCGAGTCTCSYPLNVFVTVPTGRAFRCMKPPAPPAGALGKPSRPVSVLKPTVPGTAPSGTLLRKPSERSVARYSSLNPTATSGSLLAGCLDSPRLWRRFSSCGGDSHAQAATR